MEHILSLSYGKDSLACLGAIDKLGLPLDRIIHAEIWATDAIPADLPPMVEFKAKADRVIKERYGITVEHIRAQNTYESCFYKVNNGVKSKCSGRIWGFPMPKGNWCNSSLKMSVMRKFNKPDIVQYLGIAVDEPKRFHNLSECKKSPLVMAEWTEEMCFDWCKQNGLLSPIYETSMRGGCWFCHNQSVEQLRSLRINYPELWELLLKWDNDSPISFKPNHTLHDFDKRFSYEDKGFLLPNDTKFRWNMLECDVQLSLFNAIEPNVECKM